MSRFDPVADALRRRAAAGTCAICGGELVKVKDEKRCINFDDGRHGRGVAKYPRKRIRTLPR